MSDLNLSQRAVACRAWRWMRGMLATWPDKVPYPGADQWRYAGDGLWVDSHGDAAHEDDMPAALALAMTAGPDLDDPATLGCLLALVREAWGDPRAVTVSYDENDWYAMTCDRDGMVCWDGEKTAGRGPTEAAALVAALDAAP